MTRGFSSKSKDLTSSSSLISFRHCSHSENIENALDTSYFRARRNRTYTRNALVKGFRLYQAVGSTREASSSLSVKPACSSCLRSSSSFCPCSGFSWLRCILCHQRPATEDNTLAQHPDSFEDTSTHHPEMRSSEQQWLVTLTSQAWQRMECL